jgi:hypothetical protein
MRDSWAIAILLVIAILLMSLLVWSYRERVFAGYNDFVSFYAGGRLAGSAGLYDPERVRAEQIERTGVTGDAWRFIRLPYYAAFLWPLARLPYTAAYWVWQGLSLSAVVAFAVLWRSAAPWTTVLFTCLSLPLVTSLMNGQDLSFLLLWTALAVRWQEGGKPLAAGMVLSLGAAKPHLLVLLPVLLAAQRRWRVAAGVAAGGAALLGLSFAAAGWDWPRRYYAVLTDPAIHPGLEVMPNLHGVFYHFPALRWLEWPAAAVVAAVVWLVARTGSFAQGLAAVLAGGLLAGYHAYLPDCTVLLPLALLGLTEAKTAWARLPAFLLLTPAAYFLVPLRSPWSAVVPGLAFLLLVGVAVEARRKPASPRPAAP